MADISMCSGEGCPKKENCYRYTAYANEFMQSYFTEVPLKEDKTCEWYWDNADRKQNK
jgi:hypothetical protein